MQCWDCDGGVQCCFVTLFLQQIVVVCAIVSVEYFVLSIKKWCLSDVLYGLLNELCNSFDIGYRDVLGLGVQMGEKGNGII